MQSPGIFRGLYKISAFKKRKFALSGAYQLSTEDDVDRQILTAGLTGRF